MKHEIIINSLQDLDRAAEEFLEEIGDNRIIALYAPMGAGKTTLGRVLAKHLNLEFFDLDWYVENRYRMKIPQRMKIFNSLPQRRSVFYTPLFYSSLPLCHIVIILYLYFSLHSAQFRFQPAG